MKSIYLLLLSVFLFACANKSDNAETTDSLKTPAAVNKRDSIPPYKNYFDFDYTKAIAFATVNPFDGGRVRSHFNMKDFHDIVSVSLDTANIHYLNDLLNERAIQTAKGEIGVDSSAADCFNPRHNIVFLNEKDSIVQYISICFECRTRRSSNTELLAADYEAFFNSIGLKAFRIPDEHQRFYDSLYKAKKIVSKK